MVLLRGVVKLKGAVTLLLKVKSPFICLVPGERIELSQSHGPRDFKSLASTSSAIRAYYYNNEYFTRMIFVCQLLK